MQHAHVLKKLNFDLLTPPPGSAGRGGGGGVGGSVAKDHNAVKILRITFFSNLTCI